MYSKFRINNNSFDHITFSVYDKQEGKKTAKKYKENVQERLKIKFNDGQIIDGTATKEKWFPQIDCDIFLSHSHNDLERALEFSGWVKNKFGLKVFIDSNIWGNINDLLKEIDYEYCYNKKTDTYSHEKRNITTSHVHMMLINALAEMMDKTECMMFFETPNSIKLKKMLHQVETASPWIYSELVLSKIIQIKKLARHTKAVEARTKMFSLNESKERKIEITYDADISHLVELSNRDLASWKKSFETIKEFHPLDLLYGIKNLRNGRS